MKPRRLAALMGCLLLVATTATACKTTAPKSEIFSEVSQKNGGEGFSQEELRIRVRELAGRFGGRLENLATEVAARTTDPHIQLRMMAFKVNAIPALQAAFFEPDPAAALIDGWVFLAQLDDLIHIRLKDPGLRSYASGQVNDMEREVQGLWARLAGPARAKRANARVHAWADQHPLSETTFVARESTVPLLAHLTEGSGVSLLGAVASGMELAEDMQAWMKVQAAFLPKQARWQAEYLVRTSLDDPALTGLASEFGTFMSSQSQTVAGAMERQRLGLEKYLTAEREAMMRALAMERARVLEDTDKMADSMVDQSFDRATALADRMFRRALLLVGLIIAAVLVGLQMVLSSRKRRTLAGPRPA